ncbi:MAG: hypothetical protein HY098_03040 [Nitrospinae bacterium]|nr:hypothetical protein [Nitrospinota bacterium]
MMGIMDDKVKSISRGLSSNFMGSLKAGLLTPMLERVKNDETLMLAVRADYLNIYYRGGNLIRITEKDGIFSGEFDVKYINLKAPPLKTDMQKEAEKEIASLLATKLDSSLNVKKWIDTIPLLSG